MPLSTRNAKQDPEAQASGQPQAASLQARKQQVVRDAIWEAATDLFAEKGFDETTVDDIALAAGVSRRSFFRYFESKSDLMAHGMLQYGEELTAAIDACPRTDSLAEVFRETVTRVARKSAASPRTHKIMRIVSQYPAARAAEHSRLAEVQSLVASAFARRMKKPSTADSVLLPGLLAGLTLQVIGSILHAWFENGEQPQDIGVIAAHALKTLHRVFGEA